TIKQFGDEIIKLTGTKQKMVFKELPTDDPKQRRPDITKARTILNWEPKVGRAEGLKITYEYFKSLPEKEIKHKDFTYYNNK
ncbi:MAG: SDR family NAD-dependent epimerase/dehydratase, partial [Daejeonella sp.]